MIRIYEDLSLNLDEQTPCHLPCVNCQIFLGIISISQVQQEEGGEGGSLGANIKTKVNTINTMTVSIRDNPNERLGRIEEEAGRGLRDNNHYHIKTQHTCDTL